ncbi:PREDICTED: uncharacterized protein LOC100633387 [Amphimedon queenslandica]|uniref:Uncharacterized protein n=1 Tax=Amphimedon queenslandica TaxID=400682 RepID=A0A1X7USZ3_AMPQE|nr:PREDICTED: uncharacterized protein LOC100633387 [Amphimedon queenslandica]|eukprot:XP_003386862.1 PREDICTED: uncharacterized protein LOC100633387 [Amphimedon queenslandica]
MARAPPNRGSYIPLSTANPEPPPAYTPVDASSNFNSGTNPNPTAQQQQQSSNVVVVSQPGAQRIQQIQHIARPNDYLILTTLLCLCCLFLGNFITLVCLFPAFILSLIASNYNDLGEYRFARKFGSSACTCNIIAVLFTAVVVLLAAVIIIVMMFVLGLISV